MQCKEKIVYCLKGNSGFLCDEEWDGDSFTSSPISAYQYSEPQVSSKYHNVKIKIKEYIHESHAEPVMKVYYKNNKTKYKFKCLNCNQSTKMMATIEGARDRYNKMLGTLCVTREWEYVF